MRFCTKRAWSALIAVAVLGTVQAAWAQDDDAPRAQRGGKATPAKKHGDDDQEAKLLTMKDIGKMRHDKMSNDDIVEKAKEQGVAFEVTPAIRQRLRRMGFDDDQIAAIKECHGPRPKPDKAEGEEKPGPIEPGKGLNTGDAQRDQTRAEVEQICKRSGAELSPVETVHFTLWAAKDIQATFLPDIQKLEKKLETGFPEPIRSGLDKRSAHIVLIKHRYEYEKWIRAMFEICKNRFDHGNKGLTIQQQQDSAIKAPGLYCTEWVVLCLEGQSLDYQHREVGAAVGWQYLVQLGNFSLSEPLCTGMANCTESVLAGSPSVMIAGNSYGNENRNLGADNRAWIHLVQQRIATGQVTPVAKLLKMDTSQMLQPNYAEAWTLVGMLGQQRVKFAKLVETLRHSGDALAAIQEVYGWDEKELTTQWHKFVQAQR